MNARPDGHDGRDPLEDRIRGALTSQARRVDDADDLGAPAIARAGRIRRRRSTAVAAVAAVVVLAIGVPLGLRALPTASVQPSGPSSGTATGPQSSTSSSSPVRTRTRVVPIDVRKLGQEDDRSVAYLQNRTLIGGEASASTPSSVQRGITIGGSDQILWAAFTDRGAAAITYDRQTMQGTLLFLDNNSNVTSTVPYVERAKVSPDGTTALWFTNHRDKFGLNTRGTALYVKNLDSGVTVSRDEPNGYGGFPLQVSSDLVQFALWRDADGNRGALQYWTWNATSTPTPNQFVPRAMSGDGWTSSLGQGCDTLLMPNGDPNGTPAFRTCQLALDWIGPSGKYVVGPAQSAKKLPFTTVSAVTPVGGEWAQPVPDVVIVVWEGIGVTEAVPVDEHTVEMVASRGGSEAIVRCDPATGQCTRVTPLAQQGTYRLFG